MPANLENSTVATGSVFISIPKKGNFKERSNYHTVAFIPQTSKIMLKILQVRLQQYMNREILDVQAGFRKGRGTRDQIANIRWQENSRKTSTYASLTTLKPLTVWITKKKKTCGKFLEMGIPENLTLLLRNLNIGQEATVRTRLGTMDWFQFGKGVYQGCILSPCLFNLYAEYIT